MTVSTAYFDFVFETKQEVAEELEYAQKVSARLDRKEERLENLVSIKPTVKRLRRLAKVQALSDVYDQEVSELTAELDEYNAVELPKDSIDASFLVDEVTGIRTGISMTVTDSPYDDTYVGGSDIKAKVRGAGMLTSKGTRNYGTQLGTWFGVVDGSTTIQFGMDTECIDGSYPDVSVSLVDTVLTQVLI